MTIPGSVRLMTRLNREPVVTVRETGERTVVFAFWPGNPHYEQARRTAEDYLLARVSRAVEAPLPA